jgi:large subunit ribosomal protein L35
MPKIKTRRSIAKRCKLTGTGKIKRMRMFSGCTHIRSNKSPKRVRGYRVPIIASPADEKRLKKMIPYL